MRRTQSRLHNRHCTFADNSSTVETTKETKEAYTTSLPAICAQRRKHECAAVKRQSAQGRRHFFCRPPHPLIQQAHHPAAKSAQAALFPDNSRRRLPPAQAYRRAYAMRCAPDTPCGCSGADSDAACFAVLHEQKAAASSAAAVMISFILYTSIDTLMRTKKSCIHYSSGRQTVYNCIFARCYTLAAWQAYIRPLYKLYRS